MERNDALLDARILVVDDQSPNVKLLEKMLEAAGYRQVEGLTDPRQVLPRYRENPFDLVLLDIRMPHLSGFDVLEQLKGVERDSYPPVLVLTAQTDKETRLRTLEAGARDFLTKPFDRVEVLFRIRNLLEVRLLHKQVRAANLFLEEKVRERTFALQETRLDIIRRLGRAAEYRDNETGYHIIRISQMAETIARAVGLGAETCEMLLHASPMHDVGKLGIPDHILLKPGRLTPEEFEVMKTHTTIGASLLSGADYPLMVMARVIALHHHERWDGTGYPLGLSGEEIPFVVRIVSLCDVFDALTSKRPYKPAWSVGEAVAEIRKQSGTQFEPALVALFLEHLPELIRIREQHRDQEE